MPLSQLYKKYLLIIVLPLLFSGCASYRISEADVQNYLIDEISFDRTVGIPGIVHLHVALNGIDVGFGRVQDGRINVDADAKASLLFVGQPEQKTDIDVSFSAIPYYHKQEGAIFLKNLKLESLKTEPHDLGAFGESQITSPLVSLLNMVLSSQPVYRLKEGTLSESLIKKAKPDLIIKNNHLVLDFYD